LQQLYKEATLLFKLSKGILLQLALLVLSSFGGAIVSQIVVLLVLGWNLSKNRFGDAMVVFLVLLLFSDSVFSLYANPGKAKDFAALLIGFYVFTKTKNPLQNSFINYFWAYLFVALLGLLLVNFRVVGLQKLISYGLMIIIIPSSVTHILNRPGGMNFLRKLLFVFAAIYLFSILMSRINPGVYAWLGRFNGIHRNPNGVGIFSALFVMNLVLVKDIYPNLFSKRMFWTMIGVFLFAIVLCRSRNALLSLGVFYLFRTIKVKFVAGVLLVLVIASGYGLITYLVEGLIVQFGLEDELRLDTLSYASGRIYIWNACLIEIQNSYWIGHGFTYEEYSKWDQKYIGIVEKIDHNYGNVHNSYLTIWLNTGLFGLISYMAGLIFLVFKAQIKSKTIAPLFFGALLIAFFESYMVASLNPYTWQLWFGFTIATFTPKYRFKRKVKPKEEPERHLILPN